MRPSETLQQNIDYAVAIARTIASTLGPNSNEKMIVSSIERNADSHDTNPFTPYTTTEITVTCDGQVIFELLDLNDPIYQLFRKLMHETEVMGESPKFDGVTRKVILTAALLSEAHNLIDRGLHQATILSGYQHAHKQCLRTIENLASEANHSRITAVAKSALTGRLSPTLVNSVAEKVAKAVLEQGDSIQLDNIQVLDRTNDNSRISLFRGEVLDRSDIARAGMPRRATDAGILLVGGHNTKVARDRQISARDNYQITSRDPDYKQSFHKHERQMAITFVDQLAELDVDVVLCQRGIKKPFLDAMERRDLLAVQSVAEDRMHRLSLTTDARTVLSLTDVEAADIGRSQAVTERNLGDRTGIFISGTGSVSTFLLGGPPHLRTELQREVRKALYATSTVVADGKYRIVPGGGASYLAIADAVRGHAMSFSDRNQLVVEAASDAFTAVPRILAANAGLDTVSALASLQARHRSRNTAGIDVRSGEIADVTSVDIWDPYTVERSVVDSAFELATTILRIDECLAASDNETTRSDT